MACIIVVALHLFSIADLWFQMFAAILGVIITAIITQVLLKGQTKSDGEREKNSEVFKEKLKIYMDFLRMLCDTLKDKRLTEEEAMQMQFQMSYIAMHTKSDNIEQISKSVKAIVEIYTTPGQKPQSEKLLPQLFKIVACFREELYQSHQTEFTSNVFNKQQIENAIVNLKVFDERNYVAVASAHKYDSIFNMLNEKGWKVAKSKDSNGCLNLELTRRDKDGNAMRLFISPLTDMGATKYAIGLQYKGTDIYNRLKQRHQGNIVDKDGYWWKFLDEESANLGNELDERLKTDENVQQSVFGQLLALEQYIRKFAELHTIRQYLCGKVPSKWRLGQYYDDTLFCELKECIVEGEGLTYIDIKLSQDGKNATCILGNRDDDKDRNKNKSQSMQRLEATVRRTGIRVKNGTICADYENIRLSDLPEKILQIVNIIDGK